jgi:hypothetical protein
MTQTLNIPDHRGHHFGQEENDWAVFDQNGEYCGHIKLVSSCTAPARVHESLGLQNQIDLFLTPAGQWAPALEIAEHLFCTECPLEFFVRGAILGLFVPPEWAEENGTPNTYTDYRVFRRSAGYWDAEEVEEPRVLAGADYF